MRCCGISVSFIVGTTTTSELPVPSSNRKSKTVVDDPVGPETSVTTDANYEISSFTESAATTQNNLLDSINDLSETNEFTTGNFSDDAFTTEPSADETSTDSTTQNDISYTTTDIPLEIVHRDGEIIDNVMIFYPSEMSGKPKAKPIDMPIDANEFRIHDDVMGADLHIIYPTNESEARVEAPTSETIRTPTIQLGDESTTQFIETMTLTSTDAPQKSLTLMTSSHPFSTSNNLTIETLTSSTEPAVDLKSEASEVANQIENVTAKRPRYKRRKLKINSFMRKSSTTTIAPTGTPTSIPAYKLQSRYHPLSSESVEDPTTTSSGTNIVAESTTRRAFLQHFITKSRKQFTNVQRRNDSIVGVANEHELKISTLQNLLTDTVNSTNAHNITEFLIQRRLNQQQQSMKRKKLNQHRTIPTKDFSIASTTSTPALVIFTSTVSNVPSEASTDLIATTNESLASTTTASLHARFRFNRRRKPFQGINRARNNIPAVTTTTEAATTPTTSGTTTTAKSIRSKSNGVRDILRGRRPINRPPSVASNPLNFDVAAESMQKIRKRPKIDTMSSSKRKLLENLTRRVPLLSTTESSAAAPLMEILQRKRSTTTTTEAAVDIRTKSMRRRKSSSSTTSATTPDPIADVNLTNENQSHDTSSVETIEITTIRTMHRPTTTTRTISTTTSFELSTEPDFDANTPANKSNAAIVHPTQTPKEYTETRRAAVEQTEATESEQIIPQLKKTETFPDMRLPNEVTKPFNREAVGQRNTQRSNAVPPPQTPTQPSPTNQLGQFSLQSETSLQAHQTLQPTNLRPVNFLPPIAPIQYPAEPLRPQTAVPITYQYYTNQNDPLANRFHRMTPATFNAGQSQQRPGPYIANTNSYFGQTAPSPFDNFNFPFNFF